MTVDKMTVDKMTLVKMTVDEIAVDKTTHCLFEKKNFQLFFLLM